MEAASLGAAIWAMVWPTGTTSPSWAVTALRTPEAGASSSIVTLSVSISAMGSPLRTVSPGALIQRNAVRDQRVVVNRHFASFGDAGVDAGLGTGAGATTPPPSLSPQEKALKFAQCMREHGVDMPDPDPAGESGRRHWRLRGGMALARGRCGRLRGR